MASKLSPTESIALIKANLAEVLNPEIIDNVILNEKRPLKVYWGTAPTVSNVFDKSPAHTAIEETLGLRDMYIEDMLFLGR